MRICLISREFAPFFGAGIGTYASSWARALASAGHDVHVVSRAHPGLLERGPGLLPGVTFHAVRPSDGPPRLDHNYPYARHSLAVLATVRRLHERHGFDAIEYPEYWAEGHAISQAARTLREFAPAVTVCRLHMSSALCRELDGDRTYPHYAAYLDIMEHESVAHADLVLSPSEGLLASTRARLGAEGWGEIRRGTVLRYPFDVGALGELGERRAAGDGRTVLCVGRLERRKGQDVLVEAVRVLAQRGRDVRLVLTGADTGSGPFGRSMRRSLEQRLGGLAGRVEFTGPLPRSALGGLIGSASVCVFPARWDNFPNALLEAMACGAAVVSSDAGGPGEIIEDGVSGLLCPAEDAASLADAIDRALGDAGLRERLGAGARERVRALCDPGSVVSSFESLVRGAVEPARAPSVWRPLVSVIVPFYNLAAYLPATLASIRAQTYEPIETVVVDDGSTDAASRALVDSLESAVGVRVVRQANQGLPSARNAGLAAARGELVLPVDADDLLSPTFVEKAVGALSADAGLVYATALVGYFRDDPSRRFGGWVPLGLHRDLLPVHNCAGCCMAVFRRGAVLEAGCYARELTSYEDWDLYCALAERGWRGVVIPDFLLHYRIRADSLLRTEAEVRKQHLHAALLERHPGLALNHTRVQRTMLSEQMEAARRSRDGLRYRLADRVNVALKASPLHGAIKGLAVRTIESRRRRREV